MQSNDIKSVSVTEVGFPLKTMSKDPPEVLRAASVDCRTGETFWFKGHGEGLKQGVGGQQGVDGQQGVEGQHGDGILVLLNVASF